MIHVLPPVALLQEYAIQESLYQLDLEEETVHHLLKMKCHRPLCAATYHYVNPVSTTCNVQTLLPFLVK